MKNTEQALEVNGFVKVYNKILYDPRISFKAKGVYGYILSKPVGWRFNVHRICRETLDGRDAIYAAIKELVAVGLIAPLKKGDGSMLYHIVEPDTEKPFQGYPNTDNPDLDPVPEKPKHGKTLSGKTRSISNTEYLSKTDTIQSNTHSEAGCVILPDAVNDPSLTSKEITKPARSIVKQEGTSNECTPPPPNGFMETQTELLPTEQTTPPGANALIEQRAAEIYAAYPRKTARGAAIKAISKALATTPYLSLMEATRAFAQAVSRWPESDRKYVPHCSSWMNAQRWTDDRKEWERVSTGYCPRFSPSTDNDTEPSDF